QGCMHRPTPVYPGALLRLSLPPENRPKQPFISGPQVIGHARCHRRTAMGHLVRLLDYQTAVRPTEIVEAHRQPTHPAVIAPGLRQCQGLADFPLVTETAGAVVTLYHTRVDLLVPQEIQHMLQTGFAMDCSDFNALHPTTFVRLFHLPIGQPLAPAQHRTTPPPLGRVPM